MRHKPQWREQSEFRRSLSNCHCYLSTESLAAIYPVNNLEKTAAGSLITLTVQYKDQKRRVWIVRRDRFLNAGYQLTSCVFEVGLYSLHIKYDRGISSVDRLIVP